MGLRINTNVASINVQRNLGVSQKQLDDNYERLSSGNRINKASDDAAGLAISENLKAQARGLRQAQRNANDGISMIQTAEGGLNEISSMLIRLRELGVQAASDTIGDTERQFLNVESQQMKNEIQRIAEVTQFNGTKLLDGNGDILEFQIGIQNNEAQDRISYNAGDANATLSMLGIDGEAVADKASAQTTLSTVDLAISKVNGIRANLGAMQNRLNSTINNLSIYTENIIASNSRIRDADVATESAELAKNLIKQQASTSVLSQANNSSAIALKLLS